MRSSCSFVKSSSKLMDRMVAFIILLLVSKVSAVTEDIDDDDEEYSDSKSRDLSLFDSAYIAEFESQIKQLSVRELQQTISKLGKIAFFVRLYRSWIHSPNTGHRGFEKLFPEPPVKFHPWVYDDCSSNFLRCVNKIYGRIQLRAPLLFPRKGQNIESFSLDEEVFTRMISNSLFSYDVSISYLMCYLTKNRLSVLARLPFCSYGLAESQSKLWPSARFRDNESREWDHEEGEQGSDPIDTLMNQTDFQCADESFCPDPCCGRITGRSSSSDTSSEVFCSNSICLENSSHQTNSEMSANSVSVKSPSSEHPSYSCYVDPLFNDDLQSMMQNKWKLSCACLTESGVPEPNRIYRFDVRHCVDVDECLFTECGELEKCINTIGSHKCVCKLGYIRDVDDRSKCIPIPFKRADLWHGAAETTDK